ncbi:MAG: hypothetical protein R2747_11730 [Pyrinomonadaceae bacterium]
MLVTAKFKIVSAKTKAKCLIYVKQAKEGPRGHWKKSQKTYNGSLKIGDTSGTWTYADWSRVLALRNRKKNSPILLLSDVPDGFLTCGRRPIEGEGSILLPDSLQEKEPIYWNLLRVDCSYYV